MLSRILLELKGIHESISTAKGLKTKLFFRNNGKFIILPRWLDSVWLRLLQNVLSSGNLGFGESKLSISVDRRIFVDQRVSYNYSWGFLFRMSFLPPMRHLKSELKKVIISPTDQKSNMPFLKN